MFGSKQFAYCCLATKDKRLGNLISQRLFVHRINNSNQRRATRLVASNPVLKKKDTQSLTINVPLKKNIIQRKLQRKLLKKYKCLAQSA